MASQREPDPGDRDTCPPLDILVQWQQDQLPPDQVQDLIQHLEICPACLKVVEGLVAADPVSRHLLQEPPLVSEEDRTAVASLVQRMRVLAATPHPTADTKVMPRLDFSFLGQPQAAGEIGRLGSYRLQRLLGQGGMGLVFLADDQSLQRAVALKVMRPEAEQKPGGRQRFLREARAAAAVRHEHVVTIHHVDETNDVPFLVMELLQGQALEKRCQTGPPFSLAEIVRIGREVAEGLAAAHDQGLTHRDIKPDNIWLEAPGEKVKLLDFGLARAATADTRITQERLVVGTPAYMAPEQACGEPVDARTDLFSLGCVLFRLASGRLPFQGQTPLAILQALATTTPPLLHQLNPAVPQSLSRLVASLLARRPQDRPASARAVVEALAAIEREGTAEFEKQPAPHPKTAGRWVLVLALAGVLALAVGTLEGLLYQPKKPADPGTGAVRLPDAVPADAMKRQDIPEELLVLAGGGDSAQAPPELVAILGGPRYFPVGKSNPDYLCTRFSPDGRLLAACVHKEVWLYEVATGRVLRRLPHGRSCGWLDFRPDNQVLAVSGEDGIDLWELSTGQSLGRLLGHAHLGRGLSFTSDGRSLVTTDADGKARLWNVDAKKVVRTFDPPEGHRFTQPPQLHRAGRLVALHATGPKPVVRILDLPNGEREAEVPGSPGPDLMSIVRFSPDGRLLASIQESKDVHLWDVATWKEVGVLDGSASILSFSADSGTLFRGHVWNGGGTVVLLDDVGRRTRKAALSLPIAGDSAWSDLSPDGRTVAFRAARANAVVLFDAVTGHDRFPRAGHLSKVSAVAVSPDGCSVVSSGHDHRVLLWDLRTGQVSRELVFIPTVYQVMKGAVFSSDGKWVAAQLQESCYPGWTRVWEAATGKEVITLKGKGQNWQPTAFAFHPQGKSLVTGESTRLQEWSLPEGSSTSWDGATTSRLSRWPFIPTAGGWPRATRTAWSVSGTPRGASCWTGTVVTAPCPAWASARTAPCWRQRRGLPIPLSMCGTWKRGSGFVAWDTAIA